MSCQVGDPGAQWPGRAWGSSNIMKILRIYTQLVGHLWWVLGCCDFFILLMCYGMNLECHGISMLTRQMWKLTVEGFWDVISHAVLYDLITAPIWSISIELLSSFQKPPEVGTKTTTRLLVFTLNLPFWTVVFVYVQKIEKYLEESSGRIGFFWWLPVTEALKEGWVSLVLGTRWLCLSGKGAWVCCA